MSRNLIISPVGDTSVHGTWLAGDERRDFDLLLIYYGRRPDWQEPAARWTIRRKGVKYHLIDEVVGELSGALDQYDYLWCPDDDVALGPGEINRMFAMMREHQLDLAQPAIARGDISHQSLRQRRGNLLRYSPFVEVMCPLFTREAFRALRPTFCDCVSSWGLDVIWPKLLPEPRIAILDKIGAHHTRPLSSGEAYQRFRERGIDPQQELRQIVDKYHGDWRQFRLFQWGLLKFETIPDPDAVAEAASRTPWWHRLLPRAA